MFGASVRELCIVILLVDLPLAQKRVKCCTVDSRYSRYGHFNIPAINFGLARIAS